MNATYYIVLTTADDGSEFNILNLWRVESVADALFVQQREEYVSGRPCRVARW